MISAVVLTKNEEKNILDCLKSLGWCDEIIIVDDYSEDHTVQRVQGFKGLRVKVYKRHLNGNFAGQRNFGLSKAKGKWVLFVDADERISPALQKEIQMENGKWKMENFSGFYFKRQDYFLGRWLKFGETANVRLLRLAKKGSGEWQRRVHEIWSFGAAQDKVGELKNPILHYPHPTIGEFLESINFHTDLRSQVLFEKGKKTNLFEIIFYPLGKFLQNYFGRLGFLDGIQGLIMALMMSLHSFLARAKLYEKNK